MDRANHRGSQEIIRFREKTRGSLTWETLSIQVEQVMNALWLWGGEPGENVGIFSANCASWLIADLGIMANRCVTVPMYATSSQEQLRYIVEETGIRILFVGTLDQLKIAKSLQDEEGPLEKIVLFEDKNGDSEGVVGFGDFLALMNGDVNRIRLIDRYREYCSDDLATIIYSSGTTGEPKGIMLHHHHFINAFRIHDERLKISADNVSLSFLPLSHVFERFWTYYMLHCGAVNVFLENPREVMEALVEIRPTVMCVVPRFFDKTYQGIHAEVASWNFVKKQIFKWAINVGLQANEYKCKSRELPLLLKSKLCIADALVHQRLRDIFGGNINIIPCAGSALNTDVLKFFHAMGLFVVYGYGLTETSATVSCFKSDEYTYGTCGTVMPGLELKIGPNNEILIKGKSVFSGYYKKEKETREVMEEGWFHTGDEGRLDEWGNLTMVGRIKDLMKTSVGKYVSPQKLELLIGQEDFVEQVIVVGDNRPYVTALIVPDIVKLKNIAEKNGIKDEEKDLTSSDRIYQLIEHRLQKAQEHLSGNERVVKFALLQEPFSMEEGTMTNTLKLRRKIIEEKYSDIIEDLYSGSAKKEI